MSTSRRFPTSGWGRVAVLVMPLHAVALGVPPGAEAQIGPAPAVPRVLTLEEAWRATSQASPELENARLTLRSVESRAADARRRPNPALELEVENWGGSLEPDQLESTVALSQTLELGGDRRARRALAGAEADAARSDLRFVARDARAAVTDDFLTAWVAQERLWQLRASRQMAADAVAAAAERLRAGAAPAVEGIRARGRAAFAEAEIARAEAALRVARRSLALRWGAGEASFDSLALPAPDLAPPAPAESLEAAMRRHPALARAEAAVGVTRARVLAARAGRVPDVEARLGWKRLREVDGDGLAAGVSLPLPIWNRRRGEQAAAEAEQARAEAGRAATERRLGAEARNAIAELAAAIEIYRHLADGAAPAAREALEDLRAGYRAGRLSYVDLIEGQRAALESRMALVEASAEVWRVRARIERLVGSAEAGGPIR